ncbi:hypothetical protein K7X08_004855 [Anisodus acutangulus]|uniref:Uncharacterized protein n=1 Tax=Anisodus acutangulus TaxID=402998 RepID=A0A9Q1RIJ4_9SOLA|nr:hypothetical protein K7X08_004855 [Anisodus acutangulus]
MGPFLEKLRIQRRVEDGAHTKRQRGICQKDENEKKRLAGILSFITHLVKFKDKHSMDGVSSSKHHKIPVILFQKFSSMFAIADSKRLPDEKRDLLISYVLVLTLFADDFHTDIDKDLRMSAVTLWPHYEYLGCKFVREKNVSFLFHLNFQLGGRDVVFNLSIFQR